MRDHGEDRDPRERRSRGLAPKLFLFDLDGTLFDDRHARLCGLAAAQRWEPRLAKTSLPWLFDQYGRLLNEAHRRDVEKKVDTATSRRERFRRLGELLGASWSAARLDAIARRYRAGYLHGVRAVPGAASLLDAVRRRGPVGIVTNDRADEQLEKLRVIGLAERVDFLIASEGVGAWKPDRRIFEIALAQGGARPEEAVMLGDSWEHDVLGALGAGVRAVWFDPGGRRRPPGSPRVRVVRSYSPRAPVLRALGVPGQATTASSGPGASPSR